MLMKLVFPEDSERFHKMYLKDVETSYWPEDKYIQKANKISFGKLSDLTEIRNQIETSLKEAVKSVTDEPLYTLYPPDGKRRESELKSFPFLDHLHKLFLIRKWDQDPRSLIGHVENLVRLKKLNSGNYSKNEGNFKHFSNVVAATARLIKFFSGQANLNTVFRGACSGENEVHFVEPYTNENPKGKLRIFRLMLAAYYHDIGKTIVDRRHGMEGSIILSDHATQSLYDLKQIARQ